MFTVCTNCKTKFRVSSAQLKAAQGQVRCGKCHEVFDAFWALEGSAPRVEESQIEPPTTPNLDSVSATPASAPELDTIIRAGDAPPTDAPTLQAGPRKSELPPIDDLFGDLGHLPDDELNIPAGPGEEPPTKPNLDSPAVPDRHLTFSIPAAHHAEDLPQHPAPRPRQRFAALWWLGIAIMLVVLLLQLVNANRAALAENPVLGPSLTALYSVLGRPLPPPRSVSAWDVSGLNVTNDPQAPGVLSITGALENQAGYPQPWPFLRVELTDRFGQALRGRDFKPGEYLSGAQADLMLNPGQAARFRIDIADPGADAVGFTLAPCLDLSGGRVCSASEHD
ncbi:MAG TPA: DUF3426 domain-containing protein [Gammaproteobacteria bacterium]|nr:DUF3426 domain-containing protein [Gammaproteobacteria bacterium]